MVNRAVRDDLPVDYNFVLDQYTTLSNLKKMMG